MRLPPQSPSIARGRSQANRGSMSAAVTAQGTCYDQDYCQGLASPGDVTFAECKGVGSSWCDTQSNMCFDTATRQMTGFCS